MAGAASAVIILIVLGGSILLMGWWGLILGIPLACLLSAIANDH